jgi:hypothetical protein
MNARMIMRRRLPILRARPPAWLAACLLAGCAGAMASTSDSPNAAVDTARPLPMQGPRIMPIPAIPVALRGCWESIPPEDPDEPGAPHRLIVTATTIEERGEGLGSRVATAEFVERVTPTSIEGRFSASGREGLSTLATALTLGDGQDHGPLGELRRAEGDAGSTFYRRCAS